MADDDLIKSGNFNLKLNGADFPEELLVAVESVEVADEINLPAMFTIRFNIADVSQGAWRGIDLETFKLGDEINVSMGMDKTEPLMTGEITALEPTFSDIAYMEIRGYDKLHRLRFGTMRRSFSEMTDSDIASSVMSDAGLSADAEATDTTYPYVFQNNMSNYDFLLERARRIDYELIAEGDSFKFRKSKEDAAAEVTLDHGLDIDSFTVCLNTVTGGSGVEVRGWDAAKKEEISAEAASGSEKSKMGGSESGHELSESAFGATTAAVIDCAIVDAQEAENMGKAKYNAMLKQFMSGEGQGVGNPLIRAGKTVEITGLGKRFSGLYYVASSTHTYDFDEGYITKFKVRRTGI